MLQHMLTGHLLVVHPTSLTLMDETKKERKKKAIVESLKKYHLQFAQTM